MEDQKQEFELEDVMDQSNPAIPVAAKRVMGVDGDIFVWSMSDGSGFYAAGADFVNMQESVYGLGDTPDEAINSFSDEEQDAILSGRLKSTQDGSGEGKEPSEGTNEGQEADAAEANTEPFGDMHLTCNADHKNCEDKADCKEHHKRDAEYRINQAK